jgi:hypothetical protein
MIATRRCPVALQAAFLTSTPNGMIGSRSVIAGAFLARDATATERWIVCILSIRDRRNGLQSHMFPFVAYHDLSAADHQTRVDVLAPRGFRPTSLSVSGVPADARYAAVWQQRPGPVWVAVHGLRASQYQARFDTLTGEGFAPVLVSATGGASDAILAAVFELGVSSPWYARHGLRWDESAPIGSVNFENQRAFDQGYIPICLCVYGNPGDERFAGIWVKNNNPVPWSWWWTDPNIYQHFFDAEVDAGTRPAYLSVAETHWMLSVFRDEPIGEWFARHGLTASQYQSEFDTRNAEGLEPLVVQAGGIGNSTRYASVFVANETPIARQWRVTGSSFPGASELDATVRDFMTAHAIRAMSMAVARNGKLVANRGYTWAEPSYPVTQPDTLFRVASVSKIFTCAAIDRLVSSGALTLATQAFGFLGITSKLLPAQTPDPDVGKITVYELAVRRSGLRRDFGDLRAIAGLIGSSGTPTRDQLVRYRTRRPRQSGQGQKRLRRARHLGANDALRSGAICCPHWDLARRLWRRSYSVGYRYPGDRAAALADRSFPDLRDTRTDRRAARLPAVDARGEEQDFRRERGAHFWDRHCHGTAGGRGRPALQNARRPQAAAGRSTVMKHGGFVERPRRAFLLQAPLGF